MASRFSATAAALLVALDGSGCISLMRERTTISTETVTTTTPLRAVAAPRLRTAVESDRLVVVMEQDHLVEIRRIERTTRGWRRAHGVGGGAAAGSLAPFVVARDPLSFAIVVVLVIGGAWVGNVVGSVGCGVYALLSDDHDIIGGPLGIVVCIFPLPVFTCIPFDYSEKIEDAETQERLLSRTTTARPMPISGASVRVDAEGERHDLETDASGRASIPLAEVAVRALERGSTEARVVIASGNASTATALPLDDLLRAADSAEARRWFPRDRTDAAARLSFWSLVAERARGRAPALEQAAATRVALWGVPPLLRGSLTARLLTDGCGSALFPDGTLVDWTPGKSSTPFLAGTRVTLGDGLAEVRPGAPIPLTVQATETGRGTLYQLQAVTRSRIPCLNGIELLMGKLGWRATLVRRIQVTAPLVEGDHVVTVDFRVAGSPVTLSSEARIRVRAAPK